MHTAYSSLQLSLALPRPTNSSSLSSRVRSCYVFVQPAVRSIIQLHALKGKYINGTGIWIGEQLPKSEGTIHLERTILTCYPKTQKACQKLYQDKNFSSLSVMMPFQEIKCSLAVAGSRTWILKAFGQSRKEYSKSLSLPNHGLFTTSKPCRFYYMYRYLRSNINISLEAHDQLVNAHAIIMHVKRRGKGCEMFLQDSIKK